jgi:hypothetical protein
MKPRLLISIGTIMLGVARSAAAQQAAESMPSFDLLKAAHGADSLRRITARQQAELAKLAKVNAAKSDTTPTPAARSAFPSSPVISGMVQFWISGGDAGFRNTYRLRRAEVKASGSATPAWSWVIMLDLGKTLSATSVMMPNGSVQTAVSQSGRPLQDAMMSAQVSPTLRIDAGQQKIPFGLEGAQSSSTLETVERSLFASDRARGGSFGDVRDLGVTVRGRWTSALDYQVGAFNGSGESQNDVDANLAKAVIGRIAIRPIAALQLGVSGVYAGTSAADAPRRDRDGVDLRIRSGKLLIQAEAVSGHDAALGRRGMYTLAGYRVLPTTDLHLRFDAWDPDVERETDAASATERDYLAGITWTMPSAGFKAQADITHRTWSAALVPSRWQLLINLQTSW